MWPAGLTDSLTPFVEPKKKNPETVGKAFISRPLHVVLRFDYGY